MMALLDLAWARLDLEISNDLTCCFHVSWQSWRDAPVTCL
jgi:hypothetical protein